MEVTYKQITLKLNDSELKLLLSGAIRELNDMNSFLFDIRRKWKITISQEETELIYKGMVKIFDERYLYHESERNTNEAKKIHSLCTDIATLIGKREHFFEHVRKTLSELY